MDGRAQLAARDRRRSAVLGADRPSRGRLLAPLRARLAGARRRSGARSGTTTTSATPSPAPRRGRASTCRTLVPGRAAHRPGRPAAAGAHARAQPVDARLSGAGHLRPPARPAGRAALRRRTARSSIAISRARGCRSRWPRRRARRRRSRFPAPEQPGRYTLKFDLVSEGIDWFERCGSETTTQARCWSERRHGRRQAAAGRRRLC